MGMFDYVIVDKPLPDGWEPGPDAPMQTKSWENILTTLYIHESGRLWVRDCDYESRPGGFLGIYLHETECRWKDTNFDGCLIFYGESPHYYRADFKEGSLVSLRMISDDEPWDECCPDYF